MKRKSILSLLIIFCIFYFQRPGLTGESTLMVEGTFIFDNKASGFNKFFTGTINNKYPIAMRLEKTDSKIIGYYYYKKHKKKIRLEGKVISGKKVNVNEYDKDKVQGTFKGKIKGDTFSGQWKDAKGKKKILFSVKEDYSGNKIQFEIFQEKSFLKIFHDESEATEWKGSEMDLHISQSINYKDKDVEKKINKAIKKQFLKDICYNKYDPKDIDLAPDALLKKVREHRFKDYKKMAEPTLKVDLLLNNGVIDSDKNILCISSIYWEYSGGARGSGHTTYLVFDLRTGELVKLKKLLKKDFKNKLNKLINKYVRKGLGKKENASLAEEGFFENNIHYTENYYIDNDLIIFEYSPETLAPYVVGEVEAKIPLKEMKSLLSSYGIELLQIK